jgi:hypothetical protein
MLPPILAGTERLRIVSAPREKILLPANRAVNGPDAAGGVGLRIGKVLAGERGREGAELE